MIDDGARQGPVWWAVVRERAAACWWQLLLVNLVFAVAGNVLASVVGRAGAAPEASAVLLFAAGAVLTAWRWSAQLRLLTGQSDLSTAFRAARGPVLRLALLGAAVDLPGLAWLLSVLLPGGYDLLVRPVLPLLDPVALYLLAVAALLPMAVLLEGRDLRRSWQLLHGGWRATVRIGLVVLAHAALNRALPGPLPGLVLEAAFAVLLFGCYRVSVHAGNSLAGKVS
ncbi:hypothetical protein AB0O31_24675 [Kitasatospora cineracea]|uniref:hypothetical protein n=1 Tax=Kitasatospora cineracea TaxID=88074 RepID=UPI00342926A6